MMERSASDYAFLMAQVSQRTVGFMVHLFRRLCVSSYRTLPLVGDLYMALYMRGLERELLDFWKGHYGLLPFDVVLPQFYDCEASVAQWTIAIRRNVAVTSAIRLD